MDLTTPLIILCFIVLAVISLIAIFNIWNSKSNLFNQISHNESQEKKARSIPDLSELKKLEANARKRGSGIAKESLLGIWKFISVWGKGQEKQNSLIVSLLKIFNATLEISEGEINNPELDLKVVNSINFGILYLLFSGRGTLEGVQPRLPFYFDCIEIKIGTKSVFGYELKLPSKQEMPFFSLIAMDTKGKWLSARGRGGGLAVWIREDV